MGALDTGANAPEFCLQDAESGERRRTTWDRLTLLVFFKVTCPTCQLSMPYWERFNAYHEAGLRIWGVVEDPSEDARAFAAEYGMTFPVLTDLHPYVVSEEYGLTNVPTAFLVEPGGRIARNIVGFSIEAYNVMARDIAARLGVKPIAPFALDDGVPAFKPG